MPETSGSAVFLSYASQDAAAVLRLAEALRAAGGQGALTLPGVRA